MVNSAEFLSHVLEAVIDSAGFVEPVAALVRAENVRIADDRAKIEDRCRKFVEAGVKLDPTPMSPTQSEPPSRPPSVVSEDPRTNPEAYHFASSSPSSGSDWFVTTAKDAKDGNRLARANARYPPMVKPAAVEGLKVIKPVNELFADAIDYHDYHLIKQSARYDDDDGNELSKMLKKTAVQMKDRTFSAKDSSQLFRFYKTLKPPATHSMCMKASLCGCLNISRRVPSKPASRPGLHCR